MTAAEIATRLSGKENGSGGYKAKCPAHEDGHASLSIGSGNDGRVLLNCFAGCDHDDICRSMGIKASDLFPEKERTRQRISLVSLAEHKRLPVGFLRDLGLRDLSDGGVGIPYKSFDGEEVALKRRVALVAKEGSLWPKGTPLLPYGLDRLMTAREAGYVVLVEGESDCWTLWHHGLPALGIPGASSTKTLDLLHLDGIKKIYCVEEPDKGGKEFIAALPKRLEAIGWTGQLLVIACGEAKDPSGMHGRNPVAFKADFEQVIARARPIGEAPVVDAGFRSAPDRLKGEREERLEYGRKTLSFGVKFLDDALGGIAPRDVVLLGAKTGVGKTALTTLIALHNCMKGKRVHYFALEAEDREIERRMKYQLVSSTYYRDGAGRADIRYLDWYLGRLDHILGPYDDKADAALRQGMATLSTYYRERSFTGNDFVAKLKSIKDDTDLVLLDHLHYVDTEDANENRGYKATVKQVRDAALESGKPVVIVAHVRKGERRRNEALIPCTEDFHGSSDIPKMATKAIMLAPAFDQANERPFLWNTYMQVTKCRHDGGLTQYAALCVFNARQNIYEEDYRLGRLVDSGMKFDQVNNSDLPRWAQ